MLASSLRWPCAPRCCGTRSRARCRPPKGGDAAFPGTAQQSHTGTAIRLAAQATLAESAGYARVFPTPLVAAEG